jgi:hypothetical protein
MFILILLNVGRNFFFWGGATRGFIFEDPASLRSYGGQGVQKVSNVVVEDAFETEKFPLGFLFIATAGLSP